MKDERNLDKAQELSDDQIGRVTKIVTVLKLEPNTKMRCNPAKSSSKEGGDPADSSVAPAKETTEGKSDGKSDTATIHKAGIY